MRQVSKTRDGAFWLVVLGLLLGSASSRAPVAAQNAQLTDKDVLPVVEKCARCHGATLQMSDLDLRSVAGMLKGGKSGPAVVPGDPEKSLLIQAVRQTGALKMPNGQPLPARESARPAQWPMTVEDTTPLSRSGPVSQLGMRRAAKSVIAPTITAMRTTPHCRTGIG